MLVLHILPLLVIHQVLYCQLSSLVAAIGAVLAYGFSLIGRVCSLLVPGVLPHEVCDFLERLVILC